MAPNRETVSSQNQLECVMPSIVNIGMNDHRCKRLDRCLHRSTLEVCVFEEIEIPLTDNGSRMHELFAHRYWHDTLDITLGTRIHSSNPRTAASVTEFQVQQCSQRDWALLTLKKQKTERKESCQSGRNVMAATRGNCCPVAFPTERKTSLPKMPN